MDEKKVEETFEPLPLITSEDQVDASMIEELTDGKGEDA